MRKVIGLDLGGTSILAGVIDEDGKVLRQLKMESGGSLGRNVVLGRMKDAIDQLMDHEIVAIGIGAPGFIDLERGRVLSVGGNIKDWANTDVRGYFSSFYDLPIFLGNDANMAALCEAWMGAGQASDSFIMVTLGTGVGGGIYSKDHGIWLGSSYKGGELGHTISHPGGRQCNCGQKGCLEEYVSGKGIEKNYKELTGQDLTGEEVFARLPGDENARRAVNRFIEDLGVFMINLRSIFDPELIVIGGGVINSREYWWKELLSYFKENSNDASTTKIVPAKHLNDSGMIGAARMAFNMI